VCFVLGFFFFPTTHCFLISIHLFICSSQSGVFPSQAVCQTQLATVFILLSVEGDLVVCAVFVLQASSLEWKNKETQDTGFRFLFSLFKKYYLPHLFPSFTKLTNLYKPLLGKAQRAPAGSCCMRTATFDFVCVALGVVWSQENLCLFLAGTF